MTTYAPAATDLPLGRRVNQWLCELHPERSDGWGEFLCECREGLCEERLLLSWREFEAVRSCPGHYAVAPEHHGGAVVVGCGSGYWVIAP